MERIDEIQARCDAATPGPWEYFDNGFDGEIRSTTGTSRFAGAPENICGGEPGEGRIDDGPDAQFIAHSREDIPYLLAEVKRLNAVLQDERKEHAEEYKRLRVTYIQEADKLTARTAPKNKPLELHFGDGKIGVSTCRPEDSETWNELLLWNPKMQQGVGNSIPIKAGTTTDDVGAYARLFFSNAESAQVVADALNKIIDSYGGNVPLTLEQLTQMDKKYVRYVRYTPAKIEPPDQQYENVKVDCLDESAYSDDGYTRLWFDDYGKTWLAYAQKPERSENDAEV